MPPPIPLASCDAGLAVCEGGRFRGLFQSLYLSQNLKVCYDEYCPSLKKKDGSGKTTLEKRKCKKCKLYHSTIQAMKDHLKICVGNSDTHRLSIEVPEVINEDEEEMEDEDYMYGIERNGNNVFENINLIFGNNE